MSSDSGYAGSVSDAGNGNAVWSNPSNAEGAPDGSFATVTGSTFKKDGSNYLQCSDFALSIPTGATVTGLQVVVTATASVSSAIDGLECNITLGNSGAEFQDYTASPSGDVSTTSTAYTFGSGTTDTWGLGAALTVSNLNLTTASNGSSGGPLVSVYSIGSSGNSQVLSVDSIQLIAYYTGGGSAPGQVTGLSVTNDGTNPTTALDLSWSTPSGSPTSYTIQRASTLGGTFSTLATGVTGTSYVDSTCSPGTEYAYEVAGVNGVGTGTYSSAAANFTDPAAPGSLAATPVSGSQINVSWSAPSLGSTVSVVQYTLNRQTNGGSFSSIYTGSTASYSNTGLSAGTTYGYEVDVEAAVNDTSGSGLTGDLTSAFSSVVSASTPGPAAPVPLFGLEGTGACPFGITHPTRRTHIEGVRFQHRNG